MKKIKTETKYIDPMMISPNTRRSTLTALSKGKKRRNII